MTSIWLRISFDFPVTVKLGSLLVPSDDPCFSLVTFLSSKHSLSWSVMQAN